MLVKLIVMGILSLASVSVLAVENYVTKCEDGEELNFSSIVSIEINGAKVEIQDITFNKRGCKKEDIGILRHYDLSAVNEGSNYRMVVENVEEGLTDHLWAEVYNGESQCGFHDWKEYEARSISGTDCLKEYEEVGRYFEYSIDTKGNLELTAGEKVLKFKNLKIKGLKK